MGISCSPHSLEANDQTKLRTSCLPSLRFFKVLKDHILILGPYCRPYDHRRELMVIFSLVSLFLSFFLLFQSWYPTTLPRNKLFLAQAWHESMTQRHTCIYVSPSRNLLNFSVSGIFVYVRLSVIHCNCSQRIQESINHLFDSERQRIATDHASLLRKAHEEEFALQNSRLSASLIAGLRCVYIDMKGLVCSLLTLWFLFKYLQTSYMLRKML